MFFGLKKKSYIYTEYSIYFDYIFKYSSLGLETKWKANNEQIEVVNEILEYSFEEKRT